jgi:UDP-N-acetyl-D-galactosamine dehydrogenase
VQLHRFEDLPRADAIVAAVAHREYKALDMEALCSKVVPGGAFIDVKAAFASDNLRTAGLRVWRL